jgi:hypothetical protein
MTQDELFVFDVFLGNHHSSGVYLETVPDAETSSFQLGQLLMEKSDIDDSTRSYDDFRTRTDTSCWQVPKNQFAITMDDGVSCVWTEIGHDCVWGMVRCQISSNLPLPTRPRLAVDDDVDFTGCYHGPPFSVCVYTL